MDRFHHKLIGRFVVLAALCAATLAAATPRTEPAETTSTPVPQVTGPIPVTASSYPFLAADHSTSPLNLRDYGYVEREYFVSGKANVYDWPAPGSAVVRTPNAPYTTRVLVRMPAKRSQFSGNVVVEMLNPSALLDLSVIWAMSHPQILQDGDAWVGITSKPIAVVALKKFDPARYAALSWANPLPLSDPRNCTTVAADSSRTTENGLIYDIFSQVGAWLKSDSPSNPFTYARAKDGNNQNQDGNNQNNNRGSDGEGSTVERLYGTGHSQTGSFLYAYINGINPLVVQADGKPIYDGYLVAVSSGGTLMNQCAASQPIGDPRRVFKNVGVPIMRVMSQADYRPALWARRADSDASPDPYRHYEMAGAAHATLIEWNFGPPPADILKSGQPLRPDFCNEGHVSRFPVGIYFDAMLQNLDTWAREGIAPPHADPILVQNGVPVFDQFGNAIGGLRSPYVDVPTSTWFMNMHGAPFCPLASWEVPFDAARLSQLYATHDAYVKAVERDVDALVRDRILTESDGKDLVDEAKRANVP